MDRAPWRSLLLLSVLATTLQSQQLDLSAYREMRWRNIGPFRGGRTKAAAGIPDRPCVFLVGVVNGGVWKTTDCGRVWNPIFDDQPTGSVGAIALASSNPDVVYVGSGEGLQRPDLSTGDGIYKSTDGGKTWNHLGLRDGQQIPQIVVDPRNPDRLFVAVLGHPYGPNSERGIFRSVDGGHSFQKVLYRDENTGAADIAMDPSDSNVLYAVLWESRQAPWENGVFNGLGSGLYKSSDGGDTWRPLTQGLPTISDGLGRIGVTVAPSNPRRLYATVEVRGQGWVYRSDDGGESWRRTSEDTRVAGRPSDFAEVKVDPTNPDVVYSGSVVTWKSTDGGSTWTGFRGAPGGDDYHRLWINPRDPRIILIASDQGVIITQNGGETWSSWYNQPTAQFYHVSTDNSFPYRVCGGQQESGSACVRSRGDHGAISFRDWSPVGVEEYGYVAADPLDPDIVYGGRVSRFDRRTGQTQQIAPRAIRSPTYRVLRTAPVLFSPIDPRTLYFASNTVWRTRNGGLSWTAISPDLTRHDSVVPANVGVYAGTATATARHPGVVYTLAPSYKSSSVIWAGTDDGLIHVTFDGGMHWKDVTPGELTPWAKVSLIDASHFDSLTAYAAVNTFRLDDLRPHIYRTRDGGRSWTHITTGIPDGAIANAVREDPARRGLLFAGTEREVYVSLDDGNHWQSLRFNMPATSIRDLVIKDDDLVVGTHGRGFWILDDITPLRQLTDTIAGAAIHLFRPQRATRVRWNLNPDTPLPPDEPVGENPPDGAIINFWLGRDADGPVMVEILDAAGTVLRRSRSDDPREEPIVGRNIPDYWLRPEARLLTAAGMHRFTWDLRLALTPGIQQGYPIAAVVHNTPKSPGGPLVLPGRYTVRLTVGKTLQSQPLMVQMDPRVKTSVAGLELNFSLAREVAALLAWQDSALVGVRAFRSAIGRARQEPGANTARLDSLNTLAGDLEGPGSATSSASLARLGGELNTLYDILDSADSPPTRQLLDEIERLRRVSKQLLTRWTAVRKEAETLKR